MDKQTLVRDLKAHVGGAAFINQSQMAKYLKKSRGTIPELLRGLDYLQTGREKKYFIHDVSSCLLEIRR